MKQIDIPDILKAIREADTSADVDNLKTDQDLFKQGLDSLDMMNVFFNLEETYSLKIDENSLDINRWSTINEIVSNINEILKSRQS